MNLEFKFFAKDGDFEIQRADVTHNRYFWMQYRLVKPQLQKLIVLQRQGAQFFAYRKIKPSTGQHHTFSLSYAPKNLKNLFPYQARSLAHICSALMTKGAAVDGSDTGTGKTFVALAVARELHKRPAVTCKLAGIAGWKRACKYMGVEPYFIVNWEMAKSGKYSFAKRTQDAFSGIWSYNWDVPKDALLIFDEVHLANHETSQNFLYYTASKGLPSLSLSATFADNPVHMKSLMHVIGAIDKEQFPSWLKEHGSFTNGYDEEETLSSVEGMKEFNKILFPAFGYRVSYNDPDVKKFFPESVLHTEIITLSKRETAKQNKFYTELLTKAEQYRLMGKQAEILVANLRYRQMTELLKVDSLADLAREYMYEGKSVAIFVNFRETLNYLSKTLKTNSLIYGTQEKDGINREKVISLFQSGKSRIIVSMVDAGGTSIDLHDLIGNHQRVSLICPTYKTITLKQILGRTHRAGSKTIPIIKLVYAAGTIEEQIAEKVNDKLDNISALNDGDLMVADIFKMKGNL
jgi:superfamily II DNA or RNA helicase